MMLPSFAFKHLYRKLGRRSVEIKQLHTLYFGNTRLLQQEFSVIDKHFWRYINTSIHLSDKSNAKDAKTYDERPSPKEDVKVIKQSATGDIVVKTESDVNNVVTKVTIEKSSVGTLPPKQPAPSPGKIFVYCKDYY